MDYGKKQNKLLYHIALQVNTFNISHIKTLGKVKTQ